MRSSVSVIFNNDGALLGAYIAGLDEDERLQTMDELAELWSLSIDGATLAPAYERTLKMLDDEDTATLAQTRSRVRGYEVEADAEALAEEFADADDPRAALLAAVKLIIAECIEAPENIIESLCAALTPFQRSEVLARTQERYVALHTGSLN